MFSCVCMCDFSTPIFHPPNFSLGWLILHVQQPYIKYLQVKSISDLTNPFIQDRLYNPRKSSHSFMYVAATISSILLQQHNTTTAGRQHLIASSLFFEIFHIRCFRRSAINFESSEGGNISTGIVFYVERQTLDSLKFDIFECGWRTRFSQVSGSQFQCLFWIDIVAIFKPQVFSIDENVNLGRILFRIKTLIEFCEFDRMDLCEKKRKRRR